jgi:hypothetical protein
MAWVANRATSSGIKSFPLFWHGTGNDDAIRRSLRTGQTSAAAELNLAKVGVEGSNPFARSIFFHDFSILGE